jgi:hypothetical protein
MQSERNESRLLSEFLPVWHDVCGSGERIDPDLAMPAARYGTGADDQRAAG